MASTYEKIATTTLGSAAASIAFTSISGSYTDLVLILSGSQNVAGSNYMRFNSDGATNYSQTFMFGDGSTATSSRSTNTEVPPFFYIGTDQATVVINLMNYSNTTTYKTLLVRSNGGGFVSARVGLWRSTSAINRIDIYAGSTNTFNTGFTATIYGILKA